VLLQDVTEDAGAGEHEPNDHPGGAAADDTAVVRSIESG